MAPFRSAVSHLQRDAIPRTTSRSVKIDATVFLRIAKHAKQNFPNAASGSLLGLDEVVAASPSASSARADGRQVESSHVGVQVTGAFGYKLKGSGEASADEAFTEYQLGMLEAIGEVRGDANACGWYESTCSGNFLTEALIENQYQFQKEVPTALVLVYDVSKVSFAAFRLTDKAMQQRATADDQMPEDADCFAHFPSSELLEEIPIFLHTSPLVDTLVFQSARGDSFETSFDVDRCLPEMEQNLALLQESLEELSAVQRELQMQDRMTKAQKQQPRFGNFNRAAPLKTLDSLNLMQQIQKRCTGLNGVTKDTTKKLVLLKNSEGGLTEKLEM
eukprot:g10598.t1